MKMTPDRVQVMEADRQREEDTLTEVRADEKGYDISMGAMGFYLKKTDCDAAGIVPQSGMKIIMFGRGLGSRIRGVMLDGKPLYYRTEQEEEEMWKAEAERAVVHKKRIFERSKKARLDAMYEKLPEVFRARIDRFRTNNPDFRWDMEDYEMFCCTEAVKFAKALKTPEQVEALQKEKWGGPLHKKARVKKGHSGNTFGAARVLAYWFLKDPASVVMLHGALCPMLGCVGYGCVPKGMAKA